MEIASRDSDFSKALSLTLIPHLGAYNERGEFLISTAQPVDENALWSHSTVIMAIFLRA